MKTKLNVTTIWAENNTFHFGEKHQKKKIWRQKKGKDSVNFIGSFDNLVMSNILDILLLATGLRLKVFQCSS